MALIDDLKRPIQRWKGSSTVLAILHTVDPADGSVTPVSTGSMGLGGGSVADFPSKAAVNRTPQYGGLVGTPAKLITINGMAYQWTGVALQALAPGTLDPAPTPPPVTPTLTATPGVNQNALNWGITNGPLTGQNLGRTVNGVTVALSVSASATSYVDAGLVAGVQASYTLVQSNTTGDSGTATAVGVPLGAAPTVPTAPTVFTVTPGVTQNTVAWNLQSGVTAINLTENGVSVSIAANQTGIVRTGLTAGTTYTYVISFTNGTGTGPASTATGVPTAAPVAPSAPTGFTATAGNNQVALAWAVPPAGLSSINMTRSPAFSTPPTLATTASNYVDATALNGTAYTYSLYYTNIAGTSGAAITPSVTPVAATVAPLSNAPVWENTAAPQRVVAAITNDAGYAVHDQLISVTLPAGTTASNTTLRVYEHGARGSIDRGSERRYGAQDYNRFFRGLPVFLENGQATFKALGRFDPGETRTFQLIWGNPAATPRDYAHLSLVTTTATEYQLGRTGPDTQELRPTTISLPLAPTTNGNGSVTFGQTPIVLRLLQYTVQGDAATYALTAGTATVTNRNYELLATGTLTGATRSGQTGPDWTGTYTARYRHRAVGTTRTDNTGVSIKGVDVLRVSLTLTAAQGYTPASGAEMKLLELYHGNTSTNYQSLGMWYRVDGAAAQAGGTAAVPMGNAVTTGMVGGSGNVYTSALRVRNLAFTNWGAAVPASAGYRSFGANTVGINTAALSTAVPAGATIQIDFDFAINYTVVTGANTPPPELAQVMDALGVNL